jgi:ATP-dependent RNA helicase RhlE
MRLFFRRDPGNHFLKRFTPEGVFLSFETFGFHPEIAAGIRAAHYAEPTSIQEQAIPPVLEGKDVLGLAQTGTGKTAAFVLPILERLRRGERKKVRALVIAPTRELAEQIHETIRALGKKTGISSVTLYGGVNIRPQIQALKKGVELAVACPGRLLDHLRQGTLRLSALEVLVLDEADQMFDMGFLPDIRRILGHIPRKRQTLLFGATMPPEIRSLAGEILVDPVTVKVGETAPAVTVSHAVYPVQRHLKTPLLLKILRETTTGSVLVFTRTKHRARRLGEELARAGFQAASLQGDLPQNRRREAMDGFRDGSHLILAATDIAARGLDVSRISHVINYDVPETAETYIHRIGRTGRAYRKGDAITLVAPEDEALMSSIERMLGLEPERRNLADFSCRFPGEPGAAGERIGAARLSLSRPERVKYAFLGARGRNRSGPRSASPLGRL